MSLDVVGGFDSNEFEDACSKKCIIANIKPNLRNKLENEVSEIGVNIFDDELYKGSYVIERTNAYMGGFKALLVRFVFYGVLGCFLTKNY